MATKIDGRTQCLRSQSQELHEKYMRAPPREQNLYVSRGFRTCHVPMTAVHFKFRGVLLLSSNIGHSNEYMFSQRLVRIERLSMLNSQCPAEKSHYKCICYCFNLLRLVSRQDWGVDKICHLSPIPFKIIFHPWIQVPYHCAISIEGHFKLVSFKSVHNSIQSY